MKPISFRGNSLDDLRQFPLNARREVGYQIDRVQNGLEPSDWKPMNSVGQGVIDHIYERGLTIMPFVTTNATKAAVIQGLQSALEHGYIKIINNPILIGELLSYESKKTPSGNITYSAPEGLHDDCVMSLAFALYGIDNSTWLVS